MDLYSYRNIIPTNLLAYPIKGKKTLLTWLLEVETHKVMKSVISKHINKNNNRHDGNHDEFSFPKAKEALQNALLVIKNRIRPFSPKYARTSYNI
ncbi:MAG: hypothetical protein AAF335_00060 [Bacteroidota bacterium]